MAKIIIPLFVFIIGGTGMYSLSLIKEWGDKKTQTQLESSEVNSPQSEPEFETIDPRTIPNHGSSWQSRFFRDFRAPDLSNWQRPEGPIKVALQVGHWKASELPGELERLRERGGGTRGGGKAEWEVNLAIAEAVQEILGAKRILVDIIPATVPPSYFADVFIAIHADGNTNTNVSGFKVASPWHDLTDRSEKLVAALEEEYRNSTGLRNDAGVTHSMRGYYAFNWWRYEHAINPMTVAAIIETGFLTNSEDQKILIKNPRKAAEGIAAGIIKFLNL